MRIDEELVRYLYGIDNCWFGNHPSTYTPQKVIEGEGDEDGGETCSERPIDVSVEEGRGTVDVVVHFFGVKEVFNEVHVVGVQPVKKVVSLCRVQK